MDTGDDVAIKVIDKAQLEEFEQLDDMKREIAIMKMLNHENVISLKDMYATASKLYMIVDLQQGGDLLSKVRREGALGETVARFLFQELVLGLDHCHAMGIAHSALCPECILFDKEGHLKISDFGSASMDFDSPEDGEDPDTGMYLEQFYFVSPHSHATAAAGGGGSSSSSSSGGGDARSSPSPSPSRPHLQQQQARPPPSLTMGLSPSRVQQRANFQASASADRPAHPHSIKGGNVHYQSPEMGRGECFDGKKADVWSIGVILYVMLTGRLPFGFSEKADGCELIDGLERKMRERSAAELAALQRNIAAANYSPLPRDYYSTDSALLLQMVLEPDAQARPSLGRVIRHEWCRWGDVSAITKASSVFEPTCSEATEESTDTCQEGSFLPNFLCNPFGVFGFKEKPAAPRYDDETSSSSSSSSSSPWPSAAREGRSASRSPDDDTASLLDEDNGSIISSFTPSTIVEGRR